MIVRLIGRADYPIQSLDVGETSLGDDRQVRKSISGWKFVTVSVDDDRRLFRPHAIGFTRVF